MSSLDSFERDADFPTGRSDGAADKTGDAPVNVKEMDLLEIEQIAVEIPPLVHVAAIDIVGQVIEIVEATPSVLGQRRPAS